MQCSTIISHEDLKRIQFLVKTMELNSFRILSEFQLFGDKRQIVYEMDVNEHNRLEKFLKTDPPKPLTKLAKIKRWVKMGIFQ